MPAGAPERYAPKRGALDRTSADWEIMVRSLMVIWALGTLFFLLVLLVSEPPSGSRDDLLRIDVIGGFGVLGLLFAGREHLPRWTPDLCAYVLYLVVGGIILTYQDIDSPYGFFYLWLSVHSFYFLPWKRAAPQVAFIALDYAVCLLAIPGPDFPIMRWTITVLTTVVTCAMVAILRARVNALVDRLAGTARTDPLTGLRNRRAYDELIELEIARAERTGLPLSLVLGDLDHFKFVNDRFGHPTGDVVLRRVATQLEQSERRIDIAARLGGEEFALVLPNTDAEGAFLVAERMRHSMRTAFSRDPLPVTMSFGIACYPDDGSDAAALFQAADVALMAAKRKGRDRAEVYSRRPAAQTAQAPPR
ncbi:MAG: GGDEF domain-containing protein [Acidimicrobiales bacterium]